MFSKKPKKEYNFLELTPFHIYEYEINSNNLVDVLVPRFTSVFARKFILPRMKNPYFKANLDEYGSHIWKNIDGKKKVKELIALLEERFGEKVQPATERTLVFLRQLYNAGFINFYELKRS